MARQVGGLAEVNQVFERERQRHGLAELNGDVLIRVVHVGVLADGDGTAANVTLAGKLDAFLRGLDHDYRIATDG